MAGILLPSFEANRWVLRGRLAASVNTQFAFGRWGRLSCIRPFTVTVAAQSGVVISTVQLYVSNAPKEPAQITATTVSGASPLGPLIDIPQTVTYDLPFEWIAVVVSNNVATLVDLAAG